MISKVSIHNFKCLRDVQVDLERFTVFVGPNASGKSSILQALDFLCRTYRTADHPGNIDGEITQIGQGTTDQVEFSLEADGDCYRYRTRSANVVPASNSARAIWNGDGRGMRAHVASEWEEWKLAPDGASPLPLSVLLHLEASRLAHPSPSPDPTVMSPDGSGMHSALAHIALSDPESWQALQDRLRQIVPAVRRLRHTMKRANSNVPALLFDMIGAGGLPASQVSEGTLLVLGLLTALEAADGSRLVLLDDLDRGLHPKAQKELITLLRGLLDTNPDLQLVATTHSPYMLDCMGVNEVRMTFLKDDGATMCAPLTSHPKFPKWKDEMTPGEMWSLFGEKWVVEEVTA